MDRPNRTSDIRQVDSSWPNDSLSTACPPVNHPTPPTAASPSQWPRPQRIGPSRSTVCRNFTRKLQMVQDNSARNFPTENVTFLWRPTQERTNRILGKPTWTRNVCLREKAFVRNRKTTVTIIYHVGSFYRFVLHFITIDSLLSRRFLYAAPAHNRGHNRNTLR